MGGARVHDPVAGAAHRSPPPLPFLTEVDCATLKLAGDNLILDIARDEVESEGWDDGSGWLAALAPLRADVLAGDFRLFYLLWLTAIEADAFEPNEQEPLRGAGPLTGALEAFADFLQIDRDLVAAAAERPADPIFETPASSEASHQDDRRDDGQGENRRARAAA